MPLSPIDTELQRLLKFQSKQIDFLKSGIRMRDICGSHVDDLMLRAIASRFQLAQQFLSAAEKLRRMRPASFRNSISRSYYAMYHLARSVSFVYHLGDDHQEHKDLHKGIPDEFPDCEKWRNSLKEARLRRNEADYDPFPIDEMEFAASSKIQLETAEEFSGVAASYLTGKGCKL